MTKALITIEVDIDTYGIPVQTGLGENSNPSHPGQRHIQNSKRGYIWDLIGDVLQSSHINSTIKSVRLSKK